MKAIIIDDDREILDIVQAYLENAGAESVRAFADPLNVQIEQDARDADLIISDVNMPHIKGPEIFSKFTQSLKAGNSNAKFFFLTGVPLQFMSQQDVDRMQLADEVLIKPLHLDDFMNILKKHYLLDRQIKIALEGQFEDEPLEQNA
ncbi:response regulator [Pseudobacteriovorax antillogorgiicola]|uniref:Response regulator receiver domain-containing protein n=1 Tax=Pseudobacteriovorax antillogorgiicola TaxID=1513793 RepID=A0A1Y6CF99_9BACT|nr:response regulator [Pseudobacteriovorax antillogorgiicola]TCS47573.1 response regulator receiver domain-containing protein [Pseudobacteriovorax antillogorgiicola]SMF60445.1 Response regulator receiver domain-containing protein [Pseudobacteriovorax antillogorgiicola]